MSKKKKTPDEIPEADTGRMAGLLARQDQELWTAVKQYAATTGKTPSEALKEIVAKGLAYEMYKDIDGATIMKVMDILDRMYGYMNGWLQKTSLEQQLATFQGILELTDAIAPTLGYVKPEQIKHQIREGVKKKKTLLDLLFDKMSDHIAEKIANEIIKNKELLEAISQMASRETQSEPTTNTQRQAN